MATTFGKQNVSNFLQSVSLMSRKFASFCHKTQLNFDWTVSPEPEWFDHYCDQFYNFRLSQNPLWAERGIFGLLAIKPGATVLELCCGDGFNAFHFYSGRAKQLISVDFDKGAITHALKYNQAKNIEFKLADIRMEMPKGTFDNIVWDAAIEHFTEEEIAAIFKDIKQRLKPAGVLTGYTLVESPLGKGLSHHEREFKSKADLLSFFEPHFTHVKVFETIYPSRHNLYFYASDDVLPFDEKWENIVIR
ncbi:class I SAM-dependent methyltransferase [Mucilaginibacter terrenus]|uniref:class I SAM-dependent methyltransferase n=1 Tax=Mucilaginibacter terrenus TaxID=2482727 RepID=UPI00140330BB|nr:class I SAM-dependent methyltransferase [Mucilaginibacter terrenus]